ncbi:MAG: class I SAM-dependent methyltransferase [Actinomycetota bacterium]|nr:class I SAM-dependent methyltransferase [Actinomycetota bacterium]
MTDPSGAPLAVSDGGPRSLDGAMQRLQELGHGPAHDYRAGSPHLKHWSLVDSLTGLLRHAIDGIADRGLPLTLLEIGGGHGGYTEPALAAGCTVTVTETSRPSAETVRARFRSNPRFSAVFSPDGSLDVLGDASFSLVLCASVLHHVPDYLALVEQALARLNPRGAFLSVADPLWYPRLPRSDYVASRIAYLAWRASRGNYRRGLSTQWRRLRGIYEADNPADMVEYHVNRNGVDEHALVRLLSDRFSSVALRPYWSTQAAVLQGLGERLGIRNCFALLAEDKRA